MRDGGGAQAGAIFRDARFAPEMVVVPGGRFLMGAPAGGMPAQCPQHEVTIAPFAIGAYAVTFEEWDAALAAGGCNGYRPSDNWGRGRQPVINVSWHEAQAYAAWLCEATGQSYRLPSEAEWEYAARAGSVVDYATGVSLTRADANFAEPGGVRPVGSYPANAFGLHEVHGNVWEWTQDCWNPSYDGAPVDGSAWLSGDCTQRLTRGGSWVNSPQQAAAAYRFRGQAALRSNCIGFRIARTLTAAEAQG